MINGLLLFVVKKRYIVEKINKETDLAFYIQKYHQADCSFKKLFNEFTDFDSKIFVKNGRLKIYRKI